MIAIVVMFKFSANRRLPSFRSPTGVACLVMALWSVSACNVIDPPSGALACTSTAECDAPRVCERGYCVVPPGFLPDADLNVPDADRNAPDADLRCSAIDLVDDFEDEAASPLWVEETSAGITLSEANGVLTAGIPGLLMPPQTAGYVSAASYDMRGQSFFIEIPTMLDTSSVGEARLSIRSSAVDELKMVQKLGSISADLSVGGVNTPIVAGLLYNATEHRWWRVVEAGGTIRVQTSANGTSWSDRGSVATPAFFASVNVALEVTGFGALGAPGDTVFDNANGGGEVPACP